MATDEIGVVRRHALLFDSRHYAKDDITRILTDSRAVEDWIDVGLPGVVLVKTTMPGRQLFDHVQEHYRHPSAVVFVVDMLELYGMLPMALADAWGDYFTPEAHPTLPGDPSATAHRPESVDQ